MLFDSIKKHLPTLRKLIAKEAEAPEENEIYKGKESSGMGYYGNVQPVFRKPVSCQSRP